MFCNNCGNNINEDAKFCNKCGKSLDAITNTPKSALDVEKVRKSLKNTGNSIYAVGWITIIINVGLYLWSVLDKNFSETGLPASDLSGLFLMTLASSIFIILGNRIKGLVDKKIKLYLQILLGLSLVLLIWIVASGGRVGLLFFLIIAYLISSLVSVSKAMKYPEFASSLISPKYKLDKKGWIIFAVVSVVLFFIAVAIDLSFGDTQNKAVGVSDSSASSVNNEMTLEESLKEASVELNKGLPQMVDKVTQLTNTSTSGNDLIYSYKLTSSDKFGQSDLDKYLKNDIIKGVCTGQETRDLINKGAGLVYTYYDNLGKYIGKISVHSIDCR